MSGIDFKSLLIGILITILFVFTTGISTGDSEDNTYMVDCLEQLGCFVLNTETGIGRYVHRTTRDTPLNGVMNPGTKPDF